MWDTMKRPNLHIIDVEEGESQDNGMNQILNRIIQENFPKLKKTQPYKYKKHIEHKIDKIRKENQELSTPSGGTGKGRQPAPKACLREEVGAKPGLLHVIIISTLPR